MSNRPSILLVVFDSLSAHDTCVHLGDLPTLRGLMDDSLSFTNAYTSCPESSPGRASLMTGLDIGVHGLWTDGGTLSARETTLSETFAAQGYHTWLVGRRQLAGVSNWTTEHARRLEYHTFDWAHGPLHRSRQNAYLTWLQAQAPDAYAAIFPRQPDPDDTAIPDDQRQAITSLPDALSFNAWVADQASSQMGDAPFFGIAGFVVGQTMGAGPAPVETLDLQSLRQADAGLAKMLNCVPQDTVVVVTAGRGNIGSNSSDDALQEPAIKVPLFVRTNNTKTNIVDGIVSTMDVAATLYELAGIRPPQRVQGTSLVSAPPRGWALSRMRNPSLPEKTALREEQWKLVVTHGSPDATRLFDLGADPSEANNLADKPDQQDKLEAMLDLMIDARVALEDRLEPRIAKF